MCSTQTGSPVTAYLGDAAYEYDEHRFATPQGRLFADLELQQLRQATRRLDAGCRVLEVGCGTARFSGYLAKQGFSVVATDPSPDMIEVASRKCWNLDTITFRQEEGARLSFGDSTFAFVFSIRVTNQTDSQEYALRMIGEMIRVAKPGGRILVEFVNRERPFARPSKAIRLSFDQIARMASERNCSVVSRAGVLVFSQSVLNRIPSALVPVWGALERMAAKVFWRRASRGYILLVKGMDA
ncbi:MAG TPA: class I SAM-dependent methyltransferase [Pyrinomonadaceae bacterium]|nr:class I SAM-dependent methyltransferase [Pyrinomonadaceae bacterium]